MNPITDNVEFIEFSRKANLIIERAVPLFNDGPNNRDHWIGAVRLVRAGLTDADVLEWLHAEADYAEASGLVCKFTGAPGATLADLAWWISAWSEWGITDPHTAYKVLAASIAEDPDAAMEDLIEAWDEVWLAADRETAVALTCNGLKPSTNVSVWHLAGFSPEEIAMWFEWSTFVTDLRGSPLMALEEALAWKADGPAGELVLPWLLLGWPSKLAGVAREWTEAGFLAGPTGRS